MSSLKVHETIIAVLLLLTTTQLSSQHSGPTTSNTRKINQENNGLVKNEGNSPQAIKSGSIAPHSRPNRQPANTIRAKEALAGMSLSTQPSTMAVLQTDKTQQKQSKTVPKSPDKARKKQSTKGMLQQRKTVAAAVLATQATVTLTVPTIQATVTVPTTEVTVAVTTTQAAVTVPTTQATATKAKTSLGSKLQVTPAHAGPALPQTSNKLENSTTSQLPTLRNWTMQLVQRHFRNEAQNGFLNRSISDDVLIKVKPGLSSRTHTLLANISRTSLFKTLVNTAEKQDQNILAKNGTQSLLDVTTNHQQTFNMSLFKVPQKQRVDITGKQKIKVKVVKRNWLPFFGKPKVSSINRNITDMGLSLSAMLIENHLIAVWTVTMADTTDFQGFRVLCLHAEYDEGDMAMEKAEHISPILGPALRSYTPADLIVDSHYTVCLEILLNATHILKRQCRSIIPHKPSVAVGILAGCIFLVPCIIFVFYIMVKDRSIQKKALSAHARVSAAGPQPVTDDKLSAAMFSVSEESCCSSCSAESNSWCQFNQEAAANPLPEKSSLAKPTFTTVVGSALNCRTIHADFVATTKHGFSANYEIEIRSQEDKDEFPQIKEPLLNQNMQQQSVKESSKLLAQGFTDNVKEDSDLDLNALLTQLHDHPQSVRELRESIL